MPPYSLFAERSIRNTPYVPEKLGIPTGGTDYRCTDGHLGSWHNVCGKVPHRDSPLVVDKTGETSAPTLSLSLKKKAYCANGSLLNNFFKYPTGLLCDQVVTV